MFGNIDPKKMQALMKQMGIKQEEIDAIRVIIEKSDGRIVIENPNVQKIVMGGHESWQIAGNAREEDDSIKEEDISLVMEKTGKNREKAESALKECNGDIAEAIIKLSE